MRYAYVYVLDTLADWETGHVAAELNSGRYFKQAGKRIPVKTVGATRKPVKTQGGTTIVPDVLASEVSAENTAVLILPGADTWQDAKHRRIVETAGKLLAKDVLVAAICGATAALAAAGLLDHRPHTSNAPGYLKMACASYGGEAHYVNERAVRDRNLITASSAGSLAFARSIIAQLDVFAPDTLECWYHYFDGGDPKHFLEMLKTLPKK